MRLTLERRGQGDLFPDAADYYACPCCLVAYPREAVQVGKLTEEHVPPKRLGGSALLLTCFDCNSYSGMTFDAHAITRSHADNFVRDFVDNKANDQVLPVTFSVDGIPVRGEVRLTEGNVQLFGVEAKNDRRVMDAQIEAIKAHYGNESSVVDLSFTVHTDFDEARARISWIRSAYLAAFAAFGWTYVLVDEMRPYRSQLQQPDVEVVPTYVARDTSASPTSRRILLVTSPDELQCVAVTMGEHTVFLPSPLRPLACDELTKRLVRRCTPEGQLRVHLEGKEVPWPKWPTYLLDPHPEDLKSIGS
ncbi:hypothetical protein GCM10029964_014680 [Kibdelosporangium lantanae]